MLPNQINNYQLYITYVLFKYQFEYITLIHTKEKKKIEKKENMISYHIFIQLFYLNYEVLLISNLISNISLSNHIIFSITYSKYIFLFKLIVNTMWCYLNIHHDYS